MSIALKAVCSWWMVREAVKEELKFALVEHGQLSELVAGTTMMPELFADNWDIMMNVRIDMHCVYTPFWLVLSLAHIILNIYVCVHMIILIVAVAITESYFSSGHSKIYYFEVSCNGDEPELSNCSYNYTNTSEPLDSWYSDQRAGVTCEPSSLSGNINNTLILYH